MTRAPARLGDLDGERADPTPGAVQQDALALAQPGVVAEGLERRQRGRGEGRGLLEREAGGLGQQQLLAGDRVLRVRAGTRHRPEHGVAGTEPCHARPDGLDLPCQVESEDEGRFHAEDQPERPLAQLAVEGVHGRRLHADEDLARSRRGFREIADDDAVDAAEGFRDRRFHPAPPPLNVVYGIRRTLPVVCRPSRARWASAASARG